MRIAQTAVFSLLFVLLSVTAGFGQSSSRFDRSISGRLLYDYGEFGCDGCVINLLMSGIRPVMSTYVDLSGRFTFRQVSRGTYTIQMEIQGFEEVRYDVEIGNSVEQEASVMILLVRKAGVVQRDSGHVVDASELMERFPKKALAAYKKGMDEKRKTKNAEALRHFEEAIRIAPDFYQAHNELGIAYKEAGRVDDAEREFQRAYQLNESSTEPLVNLMGLYIDENRPDRAVTIGEEAVKKNSRSASAFLNFGMALYKLSMLDRAENALKRALELAPKMASVRLMLANVYLKLRNRDKLIEQLDSYLAENPQGEQRRDAEEMREQVLATTGQ